MITTVQKTLFSTSPHSPKKLVHSLMTVASGPLLENVDFLNGLVTFLRLG